MDNDFCYVIPNLYMGSENLALDSELLHKLNIKHVLSLGISAPNFEGINYKYMSVFDFAEFNIVPHLPRAFEFIDTARRADENVYVHCYAGISRSATVVIGYLMKLNGWTYNKSFQYLKSLRSCVRPNVGFERQLLNIEDQLMNGFAYN